MDWLCGSQPHFIHDRSLIQAHCSLSPPKAMIILFDDIDIFPFRENLFRYRFILLSIPINIFGNSITISISFLICQSEGFSKHKRRKKQKRVSDKSKAKQYRVSGSTNDVDGAAGAAAVECGVDTNISSQCKNRYLIDFNFVACVAASEQCYTTPQWVYNVSAANKSTPLTCSYFSDSLLNGVLSLLRCVLFSFFSILVIFQVNSASSCTI